MDTDQASATKAAELAEVRRELREARETIARLNRRCQKAESGLLAKSTSVRFRSAIEAALRHHLEEERARVRRHKEALRALIGHACSSPDCASDPLRPCGRARHALDEDRGSR